MIFCEKEGMSEFSKLNCDQFENWSLLPDFPDL